MSEVGTAKYFGIGAIFMALAGAAIVVYSLVAGESAQGNSQAMAGMGIIVAVVLFVLLAIIAGVMLYRQSKK
jgi:heme/copper-type cytochrome/quinol oxidase subunit 2